MGSLYGGFHLLEFFARGAMALSMHHGPGYCPLGDGKRGQNFLYCAGRYMRLDAAAARALNVLRSKTDSSDTFSIYGLLNRGKTAMGKRLLKARRLGRPH
jgi:hypothetical protein